MQNFIYRWLPSMYKSHGIEKGIISGREVQDFCLITFLRVTEPLDLKKKKKVNKKFDEAH